MKKITFTASISIWLQENYQKNPDDFQPVTPKAQIFLKKKQKILELRDFYRTSFQLPGFLLVHDSLDNHAHTEEPGEGHEEGNGSGNGVEELVLLVTRGGELFDPGTCVPEVAILALPLHRVVLDDRLLQHVHEKHLGGSFLLIPSPTTTTQFFESKFP